MRTAAASSVGQLLSAALASGEETKSSGQNFSSSSPPSFDRRTQEVRLLTTRYDPPLFRTKEEWLARAQYLRQHILVCAGLWPMPERTPLRHQIFGQINRRRDGYTIERVYFESLPGFYVTGNLYRPVAASSKLPAVLCPHGHWNYGRIENNEICSEPGRAINFARQGYIAFSYDMIGFNDSMQISHGFGGEREHLWGINALGLHLWNSIRAVDFLLSLPEVDPNRIGCTGASGGGTQTFLLAAVDERVKVSAPVNMVSAYMQGGDTCENAPNLRVETSNVEIAALMAPRPMLLVSATGDWTKDTLEVEYPAIRAIYALLGAQEKVHATRFEAVHNYNRESREAVYAWFARWLLEAQDADRFKEKPFNVETPARLLVFHGRPQPQGVTGEALTRYLVGRAKKQLSDIDPNHEAEWRGYKEDFGLSLRHALMAYLPGPEDLLSWRVGGDVEGHVLSEQLILSRKGWQDRVPATIWRPQSILKGRGRSLSRKAKKSSAGRVPALAQGVEGTLLVHAEGKDALARDSEAGRLLARLCARGHLVMSIDCFQTGSARSAPRKAERYFTTYNLTDDAYRIQDILTAIGFLKSLKVEKVNLVGVGQAGLWCLLASSQAEGIASLAADANGFDNEDDGSFLKSLFIPCIRRAGDFTTSAALFAPRPLLIHQTLGVFKTGLIKSIYNSLAPSALRVEEGKLSGEEIANWVIGQQK